MALPLRPDLTCGYKRFLLPYSLNNSSWNITHEKFIRDKAHQGLESCSLIPLLECVLEMEEKIIFPKEQEIHKITNLKE